MQSFVCAAPLSRNSVCFCIRLGFSHQRAWIETTIEDTGFILEVPAAEPLPRSGLDNYDFPSCPCVHSNRHEWSVGRSVERTGAWSGGAVVCTNSAADMKAEAG